MLLKPWHGLCVCAIQRVNGQDKRCKSLWTGYGSGCQAHQCQELHRCWGFHTTVSRLCQDWSTTQRTSSQHDTTVGSIGVEMGQHPCGMLLTHCSRCTGEFRLFWGQRGQLNIVFVFLPLIFLWPPLIIDANTFLGSVYTMRYIMLKLVCRAG